MRKIALFTMLLIFHFLSICGCTVLAGGDETTVSEVAQTEADDDDDVNDDDDDNDTSPVVEIPALEELAGTYRLTTTMSQDQPANFCPFGNLFEDDVFASREVDAIIRQDDDDVWRVYNSETVFSDFDYDPETGVATKSLVGSWTALVEECEMRQAVVMEGVVEKIDGVITMRGQFNYIDVTMDPVQCASFYEYLKLATVTEASEEHLDLVQFFDPSISCALNFDFQAVYKHNATDLSALPADLFDQIDTTDLTAPDPLLASTTCENYLAAMPTAITSPACATPLTGHDWQYLYETTIERNPLAPYACLDTGGYPQTEMLFWMGVAADGDVFINNNAVGRVCSDGFFWACQEVPVSFDMLGSIVQLDSIVTFTGNLNQFTGELQGDVNRQMIVIEKDSFLFAALNPGDIGCIDEFELGSLTDYELLNRFDGMALYSPQ